MGFFVATDHVDVGIRRLKGGESARDKAGTSLEGKRLLAESSLLKVEQVDIRRVRLQAVDAVLVLVTIARAHSHDGGVQIGTLVLRALGLVLGHFSLLGTLTLLPRRGLYVLGLHGA